MKEAAIVQRISREFKTFGGEQKPSGFNPLEAWKAGKPPQFALGVDVAAVVRRVLELREADHD
jgi:hypothetical protein